MNTASADELRLIGRGTPLISFLRGEQWRPESTQETFQRAVWIFYPDGTFLFKPSPVAHVRSDLYPIEGTWIKIGAVHEFHGKKETKLGASASLDGFLSFQTEGIQVELIYTVNASKIVRIRQALSSDMLHSAVISRTTIGAFQVPAVFQLSISGNVDGHTFQDLPGTLKLHPKSPPDPNPFEVACTTNELQSIGTLSWLSFVSTTHGQKELISSILIQGREIRLTVEKGQHPLSPSWSTVSQNVLLQGRQGPFWSQTGGMVVPALADKGLLTLLVQESQLAGSIYAEGISALRQQSTYEAHLTGHQLSEEDLMG